MTVKLIIFDLDGTLIDSLADITTSVNHALKPFGYKKMTPEVVKRHVGGGISNAISGMLRKEDQGLLDEAVKGFVDYYSAHIADATTVYPGVEETLARLSGIKKGVISNKREALVKKVLAELGMAHHFELIYGSDSAGEKKPSPMPILKMLDALEISPEEAMMVGDSEMDIGAGRAAGVMTVGVTYGYREKTALREADYMIDGINALPLIIEAFRS